LGRKKCQRILQEGGVLPGGRKISGVTHKPHKGHTQQRKKIGKGKLAFRWGKKRKK